LAEAEGLLPRVAVVLRRTAFFPGFHAPLQGLFQGSDEIRPAERTAGVGVLKSRGMPE
jgi:hypothetical protein